MKMEVEVISEEIIKPSSQTPDNLRRYTHSYLDQISPKTYNPLILFYELKSESGDEPEISKISSRIKNSLSEALALYYPLAGRIQDGQFVECNDEGIPFSEAQVLSPNNELREVMRNASPSELSKLLPFELHLKNEFLAGIRLNVFSSGRGVAIGICMAHQLGDGLSLITFVKSLAALSRSGSATTVEKPPLVSSQLFPFQDKPVLEPVIIVDTSLTSKKFSFASAEIEALRAMYNDLRVTRIEALSVFILSHLLSASRDNNEGVSEDRESVVVLCHPVNIRRKLDPPLPENSFGNLYRESHTYLRKSECDDVSADKGGASSASIQSKEIVAKKIREAIRTIDKEFVEKMRDSGEDESLKQLAEEVKRLEMEGGECVLYSFNSLCRFPLYDADFGWGEPLWVSSAAFPYDNDIGFMDSKDGNGIDAYISLKPDVMSQLEADVEFLKYVN